MKLNLALFVSFIFSTTFTNAQTLYAPIPTGTSGVFPSTNGNVGIGTSAPDEKLHIMGGIRGNSAGGALRISTGVGATPNGYIDIGPQNNGWAHLYTDRQNFIFNKSIFTMGGFSSYNSAPLYLQTNGTNQLTILNNGNVGIGTTNPGVSFQVHNATAGAAPTILLSNSTAAGIWGVSSGAGGISNIATNNDIVFGSRNSTSEDLILVASSASGQSAIRFGTGNQNFGVADVERMTILNNGNVGIGINNPGFPFQVHNPASGSAPAIAVSNPTASAILGVASGAGSYSSVATANDIVFGAKNASSEDLILCTSSAIKGAIRLVTGIGNGGSNDVERMTIQNNGNVGIGINNSSAKFHVAGSSIFDGNVGIGTTNPGTFKLAVEGKIGAREVNVLAGPGWPDFVFADDYNLKPLSEVESFVKENKHLPGIPSAQEVSCAGSIGIGEMQKNLLQKVEELTLYILEQNKRIEQLEKQLKK